MRLNIKLALKFSWRRIGRASCVITLVLLSSYCTGSDNQTKITGLTVDEEHLVDAYVKLARTRDLRSVNYLKSESLFTMLDSTIDTTRIAKTVRLLNEDPDRWLLVFDSIERDLNSSQGRESEETR
jgi:hypothetical protein